jgi:hypothetical protein
MSSDSAADAITRFEYRLISRKTEEYLVDDLNQVGIDGWELVSITHHRDTKTTVETMLWTAVLKRAYQGEPRVARSISEIAREDKAKKQHFVAAGMDDDEDPGFTFAKEDDDEEVVVAESVQPPEEDDEAEEEFRLAPVGPEPGTPPPPPTPPPAPVQVLEEITDITTKDILDGDAVVNLGDELKIEVDEPPKA